MPDTRLSIPGEKGPLRILLEVVLPLALPPAANASQGTSAVPLPVLPLALAHHRKPAAPHMIGKKALVLLATSFVAC